MKYEKVMNVLNKKIDHYEIVYSTYMDQVIEQMCKCNTDAEREAVLLQNADSAEMIFDKLIALTELKREILKEIEA